MILAGLLVLLLCAIVLAFLPPRFNDLMSEDWSKRYGKR
jgi:hypothetical protein